jgi:ABC-type multidrug transport system ATPase subunit
MTLLYTTHYIEEAQDLCDRGDYGPGKIIALDTPSPDSILGKGIIRMEFHEMVDDALLGRIQTYKAWHLLTPEKENHLETDCTASRPAGALDLEGNRQAL